MNNDRPRNRLSCNQIIQSLCSNVSHNLRYVLLHYMELDLAVLKPCHPTAINLLPSLSSAEPCARPSSSGRSTRPTSPSPGATPTVAAALTCPSQTSHHAHSSGPCTALSCSCRSRSTASPLHAFHFSLCRPRAGACIRSAATSAGSVIRSSGTESTGAGRSTGEAQVVIRLYIHIARRKLLTVGPGLQCS